MNPTQQQKLEDLLDLWEEGQENGQALSPESLCADCPELLPALQKQIRSLSQIDQMLGTQTDLGGLEQTNDLPEALLDENLIAKIGLTDAEFHAEGALGRVYVAKDTRLNREVAIKFMQKRYMHDSDRRERFCLEAEITSRLYHPGVVPLHGVGETEDGRPFYVMQFVRGETMQASINRFYEQTDKWNGHRRNLEFRNLLAHFVTICNTIAYAHNRGIIHRDLKPENIIIGRYGETMVVDWGLAMPIERNEEGRASGEKTLFPAGHQIRQRPKHDHGAGTPAYMSPEQAAGQTSMTLSSDIYSLGSILYKILCGHSPVDQVSGGLQKIRQHVIDGEWPHPRTVSPQCPRALEAVCLKAMQLKPSMRYPSALELASEVERYLADEKVKAYEESPLETPLRFLRQHRSMAKVTVISVILLITVIVGSTIFLGVTARESKALNERLLRSTAKLAAITVQKEMDGRWFLLEKEAGNPDLIRQLSVNREGLQETKRVTFTDLMKGVTERARLDGVEAESWFICNAAGTQMARYPAKDSIGKSFNHRDYFHGNGINLPEGQRGSPPHITNEYLSSPYSSSNDQALKVALTSPIYSHPEGHAERAFLGVLGMSIKLGVFDVLSGNLAKGQIAVLANFGTDHFDNNQPRTGLLLHHPYLATWNRDALELPRLSESLLNQLQQPLQDHYLTNYKDPAARTAAEQNATWTAAYEPVRLRNQPDWNENRGWVVIVQRPN